MSDLLLGTEQSEAPTSFRSQGPPGDRSSTVDLAIPRSVAPPQSRPPFRQGFSVVTAMVFGR